MAAQSLTQCRWDAGTVPLSRDAGTVPASRATGSGMTRICTSIAIGRGFQVSRGIETQYRDTFGEECGRWRPER